MRTPLGYLGAFATNAVSRKAMGGWLERVVFSDPRTPLPIHLRDFRTQRRRARCGQPAAERARELLDPVLARRGARHPGRAARRLLGRRHHRLPPAPGLRVDGRRASCSTRTSSRRSSRAGSTRRSATATAATERLDNLVVLAPNPEWVEDAAEREAARPRRLQALRRRSRCAHRRVVARGARERTTAPTSSRAGSTTRPASPCSRCVERARARRRSAPELRCIRSPQGCVSHRTPHSRRAVPVIGPTPSGRPVHERRKRLHDPPQYPRSASAAGGGRAVCCARRNAAQASSHREAPFITTAPKVDATDFYMFTATRPAATATSR